MLKVAFDYRALLQAIPFKQDVLVLVRSLLPASWVDLRSARPWKTSGHKRKRRSNGA